MNSPFPIAIATEFDTEVSIAVQFAELRRCDKFIHVEAEPGSLEREIDRGKDIGPARRSLDRLHVRRDRDGLDVFLDELARLGFLSF